MALFLVRHTHSAERCPMEWKPPNSPENSEEVRLLTEWVDEMKPFSIAMLEASSLEKAERFIRGFGCHRVREISRPAARWLLEVLLGMPAAQIDPV